MQYALQCRHDERQVKTPAGRRAAGHRTGRRQRGGLAAGLADGALDRVLRRQPRCQHGQNGQLAFLRYAYRCLEDLHCGTGWEAEFPRDVWELRRLGVEGRKRLRFDGIPQPWLRDLAKRFARWRLSIGRSPNQTYIDVQALTRLAAFPGIARRSTSPASAASTEPMLERYLADLSTDPRALHSRSRDISSLSAFLDAIRRHEWDHDLPASAAFYPDDFPKPDETPAPRAGRAHHGPGRTAREPRPVEQPRESAAHHHPDALRTARRRRQPRSPSTASSVTATARPTCATPTAR